MSVTAIFSLRCVLVNDKGNQENYADIKQITDQRETKLKGDWVVCGEANRFKIFQACNKLSLKAER